MEVIPKPGTQGARATPPGKNARFVQRWVPAAGQISRRNRNGAARVRLVAGGEYSNPKRSSARRRTSAVDLATPSANGRCAGGGRAMGSSCDRGGDIPARLSTKAGAEVTNRLEGEVRPGHSTGRSTVVAKSVQLVQPIAPIRPEGMRRGGGHPEDGAGPRLRGNTYRTDPPSRTAFPQSPATSTSTRRAAGAPLSSTALTAAPRYGTRANTGQHPRDACPAPGRRTPSRPDT